MVIRKYSLDDYDKKILSLLDQNARQSDTKIARELRRSPQFVRYRIQQLHKRDILVSTNAVINYDKLGFKKYRLYLKLQNSHPLLRKEIAEYLAARPESNWVVEFDGQWDIGATFLLAEATDFSLLWDHFRERYNNYLLTYEMALIFNYELYPKYFLSLQEERRTPLQVHQTEKQITLNKTDAYIIHSLTENARIPLVTLARKLGITSVAISARIKHLEKNNVILGYKTNIRYKRINYTYFRVDFMLSDMHIKAALREFLINEPALSELQDTFNGKDIECELITRGEESLHELLRKIQNTFQESIRTISYYGVVRFYKSAFMIDART